jgi:hypothetical protein
MGIFLNYQPSLYSSVEIFRLAHVTIGPVRVYLKRFRRVILTLMPVFATDTIVKFDTGVDSCVITVTGKLDVYH